MQQHRKWMIYLIIGISIHICSCGKTIKDNYARGYFNYINNLPFKISIEIIGGNEKAYQFVTLNPMDTFHISSGGLTTENKANPSNFSPAIGGDTSKIYFNDTLCYSEFNRIGDNLNNIDRYTYQKVSDFEYNFYYLIDSTLFKKSLKCK